MLELLKSFSEEFSMGILEQISNELNFRAAILRKNYPDTLKSINDYTTHELCQRGKFLQAADSMNKVVLNLKDLR